MSATLQNVEQAYCLDFVTCLHEVVVRFVGESERDDTLLLEVGLVDASKRFRENDATTEVAWLESSVFTGGAFAVVVFSDDEPFMAL